MTFPPPYKKMPKPFVFVFVGLVVAALMATIAFSWHPLWLLLLLPACFGVAVGVNAAMFWFSAWRLSKSSNL